MGALRFFLAALVLVSHAGVTIAGLNPGVAAVVVFYLLAGQVVTGLLLKWQHQPGLWRRFYHDRLWRIAPQYLAAMALGAVVWAAGGQSFFISAAPTAVDWLANLAVIPLSYYMYTGQDAFTLVPPAWSLGVELQFYLLAPFVVLAPQRLAWLLAASLAVFIAAQAQWLNTDYFGYRLLPGVLFIFLLGGLLSPHRPVALPRAALCTIGAVWGAIAAYLIWLLITDRHVPYDREVALGLTLGIPALVLLERLRRRKRSRFEGLQRTLGALSYGLFLFHFAVIWALEPLPLASELRLPLIFMLTLLLAAIGHWGIERPLWRHFRPFQAEQPARPAKAGIA